MPVKVVDQRRADRDAHDALETVLVRLEPEQVTHLVTDLRHLAARPSIFLKTFSFARSVVEEHSLALEREGRTEVVIESGAAQVGRGEQVERSGAAAAPRARRPAQGKLPELATDGTMPVLQLVGAGHGELVPLEEGERRLEPITEAVEPDVWAESELLGPEAVSERLGVSRSTLHNWRHDGRLNSHTKQGS